MTKPAKVTREDIETRLRALQQDITGRVEEKKSQIVAIAAAAAVAVLVVTFWLGRRQGRRLSTVVEIRRV
jgi:hypothetical protein